VNNSQKCIDHVALVDQYVNQNGWKSKANSNSNYSFSALVLHAAGSVFANYALDKIYSPSAKKAHQSGEIHIHDLTHSMVGYCAGWSLTKLLMDGFGGVSGQIETRPANHFNVAVQHVIYYIKAMYQEWAGAQAFSSFDTLLAPFVYYDNLSYNSVYQSLQRLVYSLNLPSRWGFEMPFSNLTFDWVVPADLADQRVVVGGKLKDKKYKDFQKQADMINKAFLEIMLKGDKNGRPFTFPIPTYNVTKEFFEKGNGNEKLLFQVTAKYGLPYFQNYIGSGLDPGSIRAMCCRLNMDLNELANQPGNLWAKGDSTGSIGVVTINLNRVALKSKTEKQFFKLLDDYLDIAKQSLEQKRKVVKESMDRGLMPYSKHYLGTVKNHFSTIGVCGGNEACVNFLGKSITDKKSQQFIVEVLDHIKRKLVSFQKQTKNLYNLEATPAESTSYRFALKDQSLFPKAFLSGTKKTPFLTNSTQLPVDYSDDLWDALELQSEIQSMYTGGTIFHVFLGEELKDWRSAKALVKKIAENTKIPYFTLSPTFSVCPDCGRLKGKMVKCPKCGKATEVYSRIVGYLRPVSRWNQGKTQEFKERKVFKT
jgi:ribonucleoside-triphosphate reductase (formate)